MPKSCSDAIGSCAVCPSRLTTEWMALDDARVVMLDRSKRKRFYAPGETLYMQGDDGDGVFCVQSGLVGLRQVDESGKSILLRLCQGGSTIGYRAFLTKSYHLNSAEALAPTVACFIDRSTVRTLLASNPLLGERFLEHALEDLTAVEGEYARSLTQTMRSRFLHVLAVFYEQIGQEDDAGSPTVELPIKRREIADLIGAKPESISRLIRQVESDGLLQFENRKIQFHDMDAVLRDAGVEL